MKIFNTRVTLVGPQITQLEKAFDGDFAFFHNPDDVYDNFTNIGRRDSSAAEVNSRINASGKFLRRFYVTLGTQDGCGHTWIEKSFDLSIKVESKEGKAELHTKALNITKGGTAEVDLIYAGRWCPGDKVVITVHGCPLFGQTIPDYAFNDDFVE